MAQKMREGIGREGTKSGLGFQRAEFLACQSVKNETSADSHFKSKLNWFGQIEKFSIFDKFNQFIWVQCLFVVLPQNSQRSFMGRMPGHQREK
jgi:hypothetical protein